MTFGLLDIGRPLRNDFERGMGDILESIKGGYHDMNSSLRGHLGEAQVDEMAVQLRNEQDALAWISAVVKFDGFSLFNSAVDLVKTSPIPSAYRMQYWFVSTPWPYRIEVMCVGSGFSPLHSMVYHTCLDEQFVVSVHASFKCTDEEGYANANATLQRGGWERAMSCESNYGKFGYFRNAEADTPSGWYLKPRINTRDKKVDNA